MNDRKVKDMKAKYVSPFTDKTLLTYQKGDGTKGVDISTHYRIPALVTLPDGTLVAAADARWNTYLDGGGLDTAVAYSIDNGASWKAFVANYLEDNGNEWNCNSATFIDPSLLVDGDTIHMIVDLYPYAIALNGGVYWPIVEKGFDKQGRLLLKKGTRSIVESDYTYYLGGIDSNTGYASILDAEGNIVDGYKVDAKFNLCSAKDGTYISNLFMENGIFEVMPTAYLYLTTSKDKGKTWSEPRLLPVKQEGEIACLIGPGRGLTTSKGVLVFPCYSFQRQRTSMLYSVDHGKTWTRFQSLSEEFGWSGESVVVELSNGNLRCFFRSGTRCLCYADAEVDVQGVPVKWGELVKTENYINSNTQLSAIRYSKKIDDCEAILISCSTGKNPEGSDSSSVNDRANGKILVGLVTEGGLVIKYTYDITTNDAFYAYSCLTELRDGRVGLLYEKESTVIDFVVLEMAEIAPGAKIE